MTGSRLKTKLISIFTFMFNPLASFSHQMIPGFLAMKARYLVAQTYERGFEKNAGTKQPLLLTDYTRAEEAADHLNRITGHDKFAAIIDLTRPAHAQKLTEMSMPGSAYRLFVAFIGNEYRVNKYLKDEIQQPIRGYIDYQTKWKPARNETVQAILELIFGELSIRLKYYEKQALVPLKELEDTCVTIYPSTLPSESYRLIFQESLLPRK